jgi:hypothetical protein
MLGITDRYRADLVRPSAPVCATRSMRPPRAQTMTAAPATDLGRGWPNELDTVPRIVTDRVPVIEGRASVIERLDGELEQHALADPVCWPACCYARDAAPNHAQSIFAALAKMLREADGTDSRQSDVLAVTQSNVTDTRIAGPPLVPNSSEQRQARWPVVEAHTLNWCPISPA